MVTDQKLLNQATEYSSLFAEIRTIFGPGQIALHRPVFKGPEREWLVDCIDSNFVSSVGARVDEFEARVAAFTGARFAIATVNGTAALHVALQLAGVIENTEVITPALTFVATCNAVRYARAWPVFVDVDRDTLGLSPTALLAFLEAFAEKRSDGPYNRVSGRKIAACVPMHTFGIPCHIRSIVTICESWGIPVVEDAAESLGSWVSRGPDGSMSPNPAAVEGHNPDVLMKCGWQHTGTFGLMGTLSFNGNKIITTGGGGMILTNHPELAARAKHITTTAKIPHKYEFIHDETGYNYRMPNLNAALGCAQMERLPEMLAAKAQLAARYASVIPASPLRLITAPPATRPNHWLNAALVDAPASRDVFLAASNEAGIMTRPVWRLMHRLPMHECCQHDGLEHSIWLEERVVNLPSSVPDQWM